MEKVAKRAAQAQKQALRRAQLQAHREGAEQKARNRGMVKSATAEIRKHAREAKTARREDWELGPLAPKRDLGFNGYGSFKEHPRLDYSLEGSQSVNPEVLKKRCAWAGSLKQLNIVPGDRVVIMQGHDKGKIDRIKSINKADATLKLEEYHKGVMYQSITGTDSVVEMPLAINDVRLVYPITNQKTGATKDHIIKELQGVGANMKSENMNLDRWDYGQRWDRLVPGLNIIIPWPEVKAPKLETHARDTPRDTIENRTFYYNLVSAPMPPTVLDELRNKFSKFRTRHEGWYVAKKEHEEQIKKKKTETVKSMMMPSDELHELKKAKKAKKTEPELSDEMLAKLGQIIQDTKATTLKDSGMSEVKPQETSKETSDPSPQ